MTRLRANISNGEVSIIPMTSSEESEFITGLPSPVIIRDDEISLPAFAAQTTNAVSTELARFTLQTQSMYIATLKLRGIDTINGNRRYIEAKIMAARLLSGAVIDNTTVLVNGFNNATSQAWSVNAVLDPSNPNDIVIVVTGQVGRTIDWVLYTNVSRSRPQGIS